MPELPEVDAVRRALAPVMRGARFARVRLRRKDLRRPFPSQFGERLVGRTVRSLSRRGKYLVAELSSGETLLMHLGMSGSFDVAHGRSAARDGSANPHDHVVFVMSSGATITYNDPRRFGMMDLLSGPRSSAISRASGRSRSRRRSMPRRSRAPAAAGARRSRPRCSINASWRGWATSTRAKRCTWRDCRRGGGRQRSPPLRATAPRRATAGVRDQEGAAPRDRTLRLRRTTGDPAFACTDRAGRSARACGARARFAASRRPDGRRSTVQCARNESLYLPSCSLSSVFCLLSSVFCLLSPSLSTASSSPLPIDSPRATRRG